MESIEGDNDAGSKQYATNTPVMDMKTQRQTLFFRQAIATGVSSTLALSCFANSIVSQTVWASQIAAQVGAVKFTPPPPPPDRDAPGNRVGGASRGCSFPGSPLTALVPEYKNARAGSSSRNVWGTTLAERPTFWFEVPYQRGDISTMFFLLEDDDSAQALYQGEITPPDTPGIVNIRLPETVPPIKPGRWYHWVFSVDLKCGSGLDSRSVDGWIQRVNQDTALTRQLKQATPQQQVTLYAQKGIWFDTLTTLADLRLASPQDGRAIADWNGLLQSVGLEKLTTKPLVPCCKPKP